MAVLLSAASMAGAFAADSTANSCGSNLQKTDGEGVTNYSATYGVQKVDGEEGTATSDPSEQKPRGRRLAVGDQLVRILSRADLWLAITGNLIASGSYGTDNTRVAEFDD